MTYRIIYSDGVAGAPLSWHATLRVLHSRRNPSDSYTRRGVVPVRVERA